MVHKKETCQHIINKGNAMSKHISVRWRMKLLTRSFRFMKLGLQGHSIFFASGDTGVGVRAGEDCLGFNRTIFSPAWPNNCPYVTNVGATKLYPNQSVTDPESAAMDPAGQPWFFAYASGGGFSNIYPRPDYQGHLVDKYLRDYTPPYPYYEVKDDSGFEKNGGLYNRLGRAQVIRGQRLEVLAKSRQVS